jgi:uncharacterized protein (DUF2336 family)
MIIHRFLHWINEAPDGARAEAAGALARAYLYSDLSEAELPPAEAALTLLTQDPCVDVRQAIADALAPSEHTPHHIALALAQDIEEVAICVVGLSPVLNDSDLIELATSGRLSILLAIAHRFYISPGLAAALAELGDDETCTLLINNGGAVLTPSVFTRLAERFGQSPTVSEALINRPDVPVAVRQLLMVKMSTALTALFAEHNSPSRESHRTIAREACDRATLALASEESSDLPSLVRHLRTTGQLTPTLILRTLLSGNIRLFEEMLVQLSNMPLKRVSGLVHDSSGRGFAALFMRTGLPLSAFKAFAASLNAWHHVGLADNSGINLQKRMVQCALDVCRPRETDDLDELTALLRHFSDEANREYALHTAAELTSLPLQLPRLKAA